MKLTGWTQARLGREIGVTQQSIGKLIRGNTRETGKIARIARLLQTTPEYLTGETDDPDADAPPPPEVSSGARELLDHFAHLSPADQRALLQVAKSMAAGPPADSTVHTPPVEYRAKQDG